MCLQVRKCFHTNDCKRVTFGENQILTGVDTSSDFLCMSFLGTGAKACNSLKEHEVFKMKQRKCSPILSAYISSLGRNIHVKKEMSSFVFENV